MNRIGGLQPVVNGLERTKRLLKRGWCRNTSAEDTRGNAVPARSKKAVAWCLSGAAYASCPDKRVYHNVVFELSRTLPGFLTDFNDSCRSVQPVIALVDRAIKKVQKELKKQ